MNRFTSLLSSMLSPHTNRMNNNKSNNDDHRSNSGGSPAANSSTNSHNNNEYIEEEDDDEMSADLLSQESPSQLKSRHSDVVDLKTAVLWAKPNSKFKPDFRAVELEHDLWIVQPFEKREFK